MQETIVSVQWLKENLYNKNLIILDASTKTTISGTTSEYENCYIPGSRAFDLKEKFSDKASPFPNTLPSDKQFETESRALGINQNSQIVVYDNLGIYNSPRTWWMFKAMGHTQIAVLDGGLPEWIKQGNQTVANLETTYPLGDFKAQLHPETVKNYDDIIENSTTKECIVIDARSKGRFEGIEKEPRKELKSGHITNSINIPFEEVLENGKFKPENQLKMIFESKNIKDQNLIFSCGSGLTACIILLASEIILKNKKAVYDGSWTEWATKQELFE